MTAAHRHLRVIEAAPQRDAVPAADRPIAAPRPLGQPQTRRPLGEVLLERRLVTPTTLARALALQARQDARLGDILLARGWVSEPDLMEALSIQWGARRVALTGSPPDSRLLDRLGVDLCLAECLLPWRTLGGVTIVVTARPEQFARLHARLTDRLGPVVMALASERDILDCLTRARRTSLVRRAEERVAPAESCRTLDGRRAGRAAWAGLGLLAALTVLSPPTAFAVLFAIALLSLTAQTVLKLLAAMSALWTQAAPQTRPPTIARLPVVSVMVPLFHETDSAARLVRRLDRIDYPRELLDIVLVMEEDDQQTAATLARLTLPRWMRTVTVPTGPIRTKPRALNYALDFCRGSIIGVYDAEDAPDPDQIRAIVRRFHETGPEVACLQGILDFYNPAHNWMTRCFTIEYATWFRMMLPGIARLGLVVPLGGTTLFFRRAALEELGGWDAHNVTEDADLGLRLARHGYRTEMVATVTEEEPNSRLIPWVRQRSRWLKGYAMTWATHMRDPVALWRDLGPRRFWGVQVMFLGSLVQLILAPILWSCWALSLGYAHPLTGLMSPAAIMALNGLFAVSEVVTIAIGLWACRGAKHRWLLGWVPTLHFYFPLAAFASYKALWEAVRQPFYWDKTSHGILGADGDEPATPEEEGPLVLYPPLPAVALTPRTPAGPRPETHSETHSGTRPGWLDRAPLALSAGAAPAIAWGGPVLAALQRPVIEFQPSFEGF